MDYFMRIHQQGKSLEKWDNNSLEQKKRGMHFVTCNRNLLFFEWYVPRGAWESRQRGFLKAEEEGGMAMWQELVGFHRLVMSHVPRGARESRLTGFTF
jgi:hypothetical protein